MRRRIKALVKAIFPIIYLPEIVILYIIGNIKFRMLRGSFLILERGDEARDNGFAFFKYLQKTKYKNKAFYVIAKGSEDIGKIENLESIIEYKSYKNKIAYIFAKCIIGTHYHTMSPWKYAEAKYINKIFFRKKKTVFLQHGILMNDVSDYLNKKNVDFDIFICGAKKEFEYIKSCFGYENNEVKYTGLARFDNLIDIKSKFKKQILLMPTWRGYLCSDEEFLKSEYYEALKEFINSDRIKNILEEFNYELVFYPHYAMQKFLKYFESDNERILIANKKDYDIQKLLVESEILVTDYSSIFFDFAFMKKAIVYYQFDIEKFNSKHYKKGYFSCEKDGFGPICVNITECMDELNKIVRNNGEIDKIYVKKINEFFELNDKNNSERILKEIEKIL